MRTCIVLADRIQVVIFLIRRDQTVQRAGDGERRLAVVGGQIIVDLHLRPRPISFQRHLAHADENAAVGPGWNFPIQFKVEVLYSRVIRSICLPRMLCKTPSSQTQSLVWKHHF